MLVIYAMAMIYSVIIHSFLIFHVKSVRFIKVNIPIWTVVSKQKATIETEPF